MRLSSFIANNRDAIVDEWRRFGRTLLPAGKTMTRLPVRDHCRDMLLANAHNKQTSEEPVERSERSKG